MPISIVLRGSHIIMYTLFCCWRSNNNIMWNDMNNHTSHEHNNIFSLTIAIYLLCLWYYYVGQGDCCGDTCVCRVNEDGFPYRHNGTTQNCACPPVEVCIDTVSLHAYILSPPFSSDSAGCIANNYESKINSELYNRGYISTWNASGRVATRLHMHACVYIYIKEYTL